MMPYFQSGVCTCEDAWTNTANMFSGIVGFDSFCHLKSLVSNNKHTHAND